MNKLSQIDRDLLFLLKGHYVLFNDQNARDMIAAVIEPHYLVSMERCKGIDMQARILYQLLDSLSPNHFHHHQRNTLALIDAFAKSPEEGLRYLYSEVARLPIRAEDGTALFEMGDPDPSMKKRLQNLFPEFIRDQDKDHVSA